MKRLALLVLLGVNLLALSGCNWGSEGDLTEAEKQGLHNPQLQPPAEAFAGGGPRMVPRGGRTLGATDAPGPPETMEPASDDTSAVPGGPPIGPPEAPSQDDDAPTARGT